MRIAVVTGTRAEYGIWHPVLRAISATRGLQLQLVVTGMHLLPQFGSTIRVVNKDGWKIAARVPMYSRLTNRSAYAAALARGTAGMDRAFARLNPDVVMVLGDRLEILAAANAALCQGRLLAHVHGGESAPGQFDEQIRHAVTKMAHLHFCATTVAAQRITQMGENPAHIHLVGAPALDSAYEALAELRTLTGSDPSRLFAQVPNSALVILHPDSGDDQTEYRRAKMIVSTLRSELLGTIQLIGPNNDPGYRGILHAYREVVSKLPNVTMEMSLTQPEFWGELLARKLLVGNSSGGIIEAATFGASVINLGGRQAGRERSGNVIDIPFESTALRKAVKRVLSDAVWHKKVASCQNIYGDGRTSQRIVNILKQLRNGKVKVSTSKTFHAYP